jgi:hypothetical protein
MNRLAPAVAGLVLLALAAAVRPALAAEADSFGKFLAEREIGREQRRVLEAGGPWDDARQKALIRVLLRLDAPAALEVPWRLRAQPIAARPVVEDRLVRVEGRAVFVAPLVLTEEQALLAGRPQFEIVRIVATDGPTVDVVVPEAPKSWDRWRAIDEPAFAIGLPVSTASFPRPGPPPADAAAWPEAAPAALVAATGVGWHPPTPLGRLGMDYGLFATVVDGKKLEGGDTGAFYALLAAAGRAQPGAIEAAAGKPADIVPIIDPARKWFASHRGDPVTVSGIARRATRISIDEPWRREQVGTDHYWELYVFVDTPLLQVDDRQQDDYPIVCCVRTVPESFPTGDSIAEKVTVSGFGLKRYGYPMPDVTISTSQGERNTRGQRMETALLVGRTAAWKPEPSVAGATSALSWVFSALAALVGLALVYSVWAMNRGGGRRVDLPDRIDLPGGRG